MRSVPVVAMTKWRIAWASRRLATSGPITTTTCRAMTIAQFISCGIGIGRSTTT